jgi:flavin-dependent dehydrogenase
MPDVLVAGGGPAGLATAIRASQLGLDVEIAEPKSPPIDKACGEGLMPAALERLEQLGVDALEGYPFRGIRYRDADDPDRYADGTFRSGWALGVRRTELHRTLVERAEALGVGWRDARIERIRQHAGGVSTDAGEARFVVAADGLHSSLRRRLGLEADGRCPDRYGVRRHYRREPWVDRVEVHLSDGKEAYVTPVDDETIGVAFLFEGVGRFEALLEDFPLLTERLEGARVVSKDQGGGPFEQRTRRPRIGRVLLAGDAAGYLDALTGEGVALAVETGSLAAESIASDTPGAYPERYRRATRTYFGLTELLLRIRQVRRSRIPLIELLDRVPFAFDGFLEGLGGASWRRALSN